MRTFVYPARFEPGDKPGVLVITFRDFSEAITQGKGEKDALWQAADCLEEAIAGRIAGGRAIPKASRAANGRFPSRRRWPRKRPCIWRWQRPE